MNIVIPRPKSLNPLHAVNRLPKIDLSLTGGNGRPAVQPRTPTKPGNVSMYDHLQSLKAQMETALEVEILWP